MATTPQFFSAWKSSGCTISTADTSATGPTNYGTVMTAGASSSRVMAVRITALATNTANVVRLWKHSGSTWRLIRSVETAATTMSGTASGFTTTIAFTDLDPLILIDGETLRASTYNGDDYSVEAEYGDY